MAVVTQRAQSINTENVTTSNITLQDDVLKLLGSPATYGVAEVRRYDTHAAVVFLAGVFLAGDRAIKIKRAVRYPFLDYSTLEKREGACLAELKVNRASSRRNFTGASCRSRANRTIRSPWVVRGNRSSGPWK
jgi:hypothetical protein